MALLLATLFSGSYGDSNDSDGDSDDAASGPGVLVRVGDTNPTMGGFGQRLIISEEGFGSDPPTVSVFVGGKGAIVVNMKSHSIYCLIPS